MENKLSKLIVKDDLNDEVLLAILEKFIRIKGDDGKIIILPDFSKLKPKEEILILLLAFKAKKYTGLSESEGVGPKELHEISGINLSTVKNALRDLEGDGLATSEKGKYSIPNYLLHSMKEKFENLELSQSRKITARTKKRSTRLDLSRVNSLLQSKPSDSFGNFYDFLIQERGRYLQKCLIVLKVAKDEFSIDSLTAGEITHLLRNFIGVPMIHQSNITTALGARDALKYLFKEKNDKAKYAYKLNARGEEIIKNIIEDYEPRTN